MSYSIQFLSSSCINKAMADFVYVPRVPQVFISFFLIVCGKAGTACNPAHGLFPRKHFDNGPLEPWKCKYKYFIDWGFLSRLARNLCQSFLQLS